MYKRITIISVAAMVLLLTACSQEPNQQELQTLYEEQITQTNQIAAKITQQKDMIIQIKSFEKIDCSKIAKSKDFNCRAKVTALIPFLGEQQNTTNMHVTKGEKGWLIVD